MIDPDLLARADAHPVVAALHAAEHAHRLLRRAVSGTDQQIAARRILAAEQALTDALDADATHTCPTCGSQPTN